MVGEEELQVNAEPMRSDHFLTFAVPLHERKRSRKGRREDDFVVLFSLGRKPGEMATTMNSIAYTCASSFFGSVERFTKGTARDL
jgi:hypothetical protein